MDAHACAMIAVWVQPAALSAVFRTQTAIMGGTAEGAGRIRSARGCLPPATAPKIAERDTKPCVFGPIRMVTYHVQRSCRRWRACSPMLNGRGTPAPPCRHEPAHRDH